MRRKIQLAAVAAAVAAMTIGPAAPARAGMICQTHPATQVVCTAYYFAGGLVCKLTGGPCMT